MRIARIFQPVALQTNNEIILTAEAANHLIRVLRSEKGDALKIFNGEGGEYNAEIAAINKQQVVVTIKEFLTPETESPLFIHLGQGISRGEKMDYVIQKTVELGVNRITPLFTQFCGVKLSEERWERRLQHWRAVAIAACEQSGRNKIPVIDAPQTIADWVSTYDTRLKLILDPCAAAVLSDLPKPPIDKIDLLIGPEGGFSDVEIRLAKEKRFIPLALGPRILRTETAAVAAMAVIQTKYGDG